MSGENPFKRPLKPSIGRPMTDFAVVDPKPNAPWVVLERIEPGTTPEYCTHGRVTCGICDEWLWLGDQTHQMVRSSEAKPICIECATKHFPPGSRPTSRVDDHRRADGPH